MIFKALFFHSLIANSLFFYHNNPIYNSKIHIHGKRWARRLPFTRKPFCHLRLPSCPQRPLFCCSLLSLSGELVSITFCSALGVSHSLGIAFSMNGIHELTYARRLIQLGSSLPHRIWKVRAHLLKHVLHLLIINLAKAFHVFFHFVLIRHKNFIMYNIMIMNLTFQFLHLKTFFSNKNENEKVGKVEL